MTRANHGVLRRLRGSEAVKKSRVAGIASGRRPAARRADEAMLGHRGGGATKQMASSRRKTGRSGFFHSLSARLNVGPTLSRRGPAGEPALRNVAAPRARL